MRVIFSLTSILLLIACNSEPEKRCNKQITNRIISLDSFRNLHPNHDLGKGVYYPSTKPVFKGLKGNIKQYISQQLSLSGIDTIGKNKQYVFVALAIDSIGNITNSYIAKAELDCDSCKQIALKIGESTSGEWLPSYKIERNMVFLDSNMSGFRVIKIGF